MDISIVVSDFLDVNCYIVSGSPGECILVDAGLGAEPQLAEALESLGLTPSAVLLTHGHPDHIIGLPEILAHWDIPAFIGAADAYRVITPTSSVTGGLAQLLEPVLAGWAPPPVSEVTAPYRAQIAGLVIEASAAPGHTEGSTLWTVTDPTGSESVMFSGDVLFAGSIGRTDLPGASPADMAASLHAIAALDPALPILPGHGPSTSLGHELAYNPYLSRLR